MDVDRVQDAKGKGKKCKNDHQKGKGKDAKGKGKKGKGDQTRKECDHKGKGKGKDQKGRKATAWQRATLVESHGILPKSVGGTIFDR